LNIYKYCHRCQSTRTRRLWWKNFFFVFSEKNEDYKWF